MNKNLGLELVVYSLLLAGLSYLIHHLAPDLAGPTFAVGLAGGALCLVWGVRVIAGSRGKALPVLTLIVVSFALLSQVVMHWPAGGDAIPGSRIVVLLMAVLFMLSLAMLMQIAYAGAVFDGLPVGPAKEDTIKTSTAHQPTPDRRA